MADMGKDDDLLRELGRVVTAADPVPPEVIAAAKASFTWRTIDAELAELAFDSLLDDEGVTDNLATGLPAGGIRRYRLQCVGVNDRAS